MLYLSRFLQRASILVSPLTRAVLAGRLHWFVSGRVMLVSFTGRKSGRVYSTPVGYVRDGDDLLVPGGGRWWKNFGAGEVRVRLQGRWRRVTTQVISDRQGMAQALARMMALQPSISLFTAIPRGHDGLPESRSLDRERQRGLVVVVLHLAEDAHPAV